MYPTTNYYTQPVQSQMRNSMPMPQYGLKGRPVSSLDEARATSIDFDGSIFYFPDLANKRIYTKQINMDGTATLNMYELKEIPVSQNNSAYYVTREEFEEALSKIQESIKSVKSEPVPAIVKPQETPQYSF